MLIDMVDDVRIPGEVAAVLRYYVYALRDPRNGRVFYIGKGIGSTRMFARPARALSLSAPS